MESWMSSFDVGCQRKISGVYCARLLEVERPQPFTSQCKSDVPTEATKMVYQHFSRPGFIRSFVKLSPREALQGHSFLIHVDKKAPMLQKSLESWAKDFDNIHVRSKISVKRSGASLLAAEIHGLQELLTLSRSWHYFVLLLLASARLGRHGAQKQSLQEGKVQVPLEVEEEANPTFAKEKTQDETTLEVRDSYPLS
eukprot:symbB.v1.2.037249.t2/scaffold5442.1/size27163/3